MSSGRSGFRRLRFDSSSSAGTAPASRPRPATESDLRLDTAIARTRDWLLDDQHDDGHWVGELEGDTILESEYLLLLAFLGREHNDVARKCARYIQKQQLPEGGWANYPGGPIEVSASVKAYFALKLTGHDPNAEDMAGARAAILAAGGAERVNSFTRYYLALLGVIGYEQCPAVPPELMLVPRQLPFNIYEMSAWSRTILVPLSLLWAYRPVRDVTGWCAIDELFHGRPCDLPVTMPRSETLDALSRRTWLDWDAVFRRIDRLIKVAERWHLRPMRNLAIRRAADWMISRFEQSDGLGAIFPPIIWSVVALKCLGYAEDSPEVTSQLRELDKLMLGDGESIRLQPCKSPVWDTAITTIALREAGTPPEHPALRQAVDWLLSKEIRTHGDWAVLGRGREPGGWPFEYRNAFYPDVDDTSMVVMALCRCLPGAEQGRWDAEFLIEDWSPHEEDGDVSAVLAAGGLDFETALHDLDAASPQVNAIWRGVRWVLAMQSRDGGWGAFDRDNDRELFTRVPFADHNAMIDPSTGDLTGRMLEMFADVGLDADHPALRRATAFVWKHQEPDGAWYGRWGVNYIYGTWQALVGLTRMGAPASDPRVGRAADWLKSRQQPCGGWGETCRSYDEPQLRGQGEPTASQTAWAVLGLIAAGEAGSDAVRRGIDYLLQTQNADGTWDEAAFTGTGFPRVFYLKYHYYRIYFPLMALARYRRVLSQRTLSEPNSAAATE